MSAPEPECRNLCETHPNCSCGRAAIFSAEQVDNWHAYEEVRASGRFNMFDPNARALTGLSREEYMFTLKNYSGLKAAAKLEGVGK